MSHREIFRLLMRWSCMVQSHIRESLTFSLEEFPLCPTVGVFTVTRSEPESVNRVWVSLFFCESLGERCRLEITAGELFLYIQHMHVVKRIESLVSVAWDFSRPRWKDPRVSSFLQDDGTSWGLVELLLGSVGGASPADGFHLEINVTQRACRAQLKLSFSSSIIFTQKEDFVFNDGEQPPHTHTHTSLLEQLSHSRDKATSH